MTTDHHCLVISWLLPPTHIPIVHKTIAQCHNIVHSLPSQNQNNNNSNSNTLIKMLTTRVSSAVVIFLFFSLSLILLPSSQAQQLCANSSPPPPGCVCYPGQTNAPDCNQLACGNLYQNSSARAPFDVSLAGSSGNAGCGQQCTGGFSGSNCNSQSLKV